MIIKAPANPVANQMVTESVSRKKDDFTVITTGKHVWSKVEKRRRNDQIAMIGTKEVKRSVKTTKCMQWRRCFFSN